MSVRVMTKVWDAFPGNGSELLCMLALADFANDAGLSYPSVSTLAKKVRLTRRQVQRVIHRLMDAGWVSVVGNLHGGSPKATRRYRINLERLTDDAHVTREPKDTGEREDVNGCHGGREPVTPMSPKPSLTVSNQAAPAGAPNVWDLGVSLLTSTGIDEKQARSFIGKLIKEHGSSAVSSTLAAASLKRPAELRSWLQGTLKATAKKQVSSDIYTPAKAVGAS